MEKMDKDQGNRCKLVFEKMLDGYACLKLIFNQEGLPVDAVIDNINLICEDLSGLSLNGFIGKKISEVFPELLNDGSIVKTIAKVASQGGQIRTEYHHDQSGKWFSLVMFRENKEYLTMIFHDITRTKMVNEELNELTNQYATFFNGSQDLMYLIKVSSNGEFCFDLVNKKCEERFQLQNEAIKGKSVVDLFGKEFGSSLTAKFQQCLETRAPVIYEETYNFLGQARIGHTVLSPVLKDGEVVQIIGSTRDITEQKQAEDRINYLSFHDDLTGLFNRAFFEEELRRLDTERQLPISVILIDVNGLKFVNDAFGHSEGDRILIDTARIIEESCRREDIICRWGGDEFIILLPQCSEEEVEKICQRIKTAPLKHDRNLIPISLAIGTATKKEINQNIQGVLSGAEDRMYRNKLLESKSSRSSILASLQKTLQERTHETEEHELRLQNLTLKIGRTIGLSGNELDELVLLAALHDIGKIAVPDHILKKPGPLSPEEWVIMKGHTEIGYRIALASPELASISELILTHHERWDGTGYPKGLKGEEIPLLSRILSIIDAFDAMTNDRPYRKAITKNEAFAELIRNAGTQFDPELVRIFIKNN